ncbi:MAG: RDD family protein [Caldilinea sp. CFX5]|nr:RDD family protein [Caldilinea sp. CFX5]
MKYAYAGFWVRVAAFALDYLLIAIYLVVLFVIGLALDLAWPTLQLTLFAGPTSGHIVSFLLVTLPVSLYFALSEASAQQATWGKRKMGLQVTDTAGRRLSLARSLGRTVLKFIPWELAHTLIWQVRFAPADEGAWISAGFVLVWVLVGANLVSLLLRKNHQTLYDWLAGAYVIRR